MLSKQHPIWNLQANLTLSSFLLSYSWTGSRLLLHSNICPLHTISHNFFSSDLFSLHIFVRLKDLHGWKQKGNKNISVKQIQHGRICKIKSIHRGFHQLVCMKHLRRCMWLWKRWMWRWMWWWSSRGGTFPPCLVLHQLPCWLWMAELLPLIPSHPRIYSRPVLRRCFSSFSQSTQLV